MTQFSYNSKENENQYRQRQVENWLNDYVNASYIENKMAKVRGESK